MQLVERLAALRESGERGILFTVVEGDEVGSKLLVLESGERVGERARGGGRAVRRADPPRPEPAARRSTTGRRSSPSGTGRRRGSSSTAPSTRPRRSAAARSSSAGRRSSPTRAAKFATRERIPSADELIVAWPDEALAQVEPDHQTAIVVLTHDDKFDEPALTGALETEAFYIGALGSRRNQERRRERLLEAGVAEEALERIMGPCGLDIGADTQEETALSILAEILAVRARRAGGFLKDAKQRIHVEVE